MSTTRTSASDLAVNPANNVLVHLVNDVVRRPANHVVVHHANDAIVHPRAVVHARTFSSLLRDHVVVHPANDLIAHPPTMSSWRMLFGVRGEPGGLASPRAI
jgi:hypothetical protein